MNIEFRKSFVNDIKKIRNKRLLDKLDKVISEIKDTKSLNKIRNIKKLENKESKYYSIRIGNYRVGLIYIEKLIFIRFLHRKDIYRYFP